jgi:hypothetical protein
MRSGSSNSIVKLRIGVGAILFAIVFFIFYRVIVAHFYRFGGFLWDAGWYADVIWRNGIFPLNAEVSVGPIKYQYQFHSFFLATPLSLISELLPFSAPQWFAVVTGIGHAAAALCVFAIAGRCPAGFAGKPKVVVDALLAFAVILNATVVVSLLYPHLEFLYFPATALFCYALLTQNYLLIFVAILLVVATREDSGFHLAAPFLLVYFCALPVMLAIASLIVPGFFVQKRPLLVDEYFGHPFYGHLSWQVLHQQAVFAFTQLSYVWVPMLMLLCVAIASRSMLLVAASLAYIPWLVFNLLAPQYGNKIYFAYHAFPQFLMYVIPLVVASGALKFAQQHRGSPGQPARSQIQDIFLYYSVIVIAIVSTVLLPASAYRQVANFAWMGASRLSIVSTDRFFSQFKTAKPALGKLVADESVIALAPRLFSLSERIKNFPDEQVAEITKAALEPASAGSRGAGKVDSFLFFKNSWIRDRLVGVFGADYRVFGIAGTNMFLATIRTLPIDSLTTMLKPVDRLYPLMSTTDRAHKSSTGIRIYAQSQRGIAVYGPYVKLPAGRYRVSFIFADAGGVALPNGCAVDVYASGKTFIRGPCVKSDATKASGSLEVPLDFTVSGEDVDRQFEFRVWSGGEGEIELTDVTLEFCESGSCSDHAKVRLP